MIGAPTRSVFTAVRIALGLLYLLPLLWIVVTSFKSEAQVLQAPNAVVFTPTLDTYGEILGDGAAAIVTSVQISVIVTVVVLVLGVPAAFAAARRLSPGAARIIAIALGVLLLLQMIPQPMTVIPLFSVLAGWGLLNTLPGLIVADVAVMLPFAIMLLRPFAQAVPDALYEAATIDGAGAWRSFRSITVPMMRNGVFTVASVIFINSWGEFVYAVNFLPPGVVLPVSGLLGSQNTTYAANWNTLMALAVLTSLPLVVVFVVSQKRLISGLSLGAVKVVAPEPAVVLVGALDTKHAEYGFVRDRIAAAGVACLLVDTSILGAPGIAPDVDNATVAAATGADLDALVAARDRNAAVSAMARGAAAVVARLHGEGRVAAAVVLGGSNAGFVMSEVAPVLPIGIPKVLVSTVVAGDTRPYVGISDLTMVYPVVDIAGLNSISVPVLARVADGVVGMVTGPPLPPRDTDRPAVGATMFGVTTECVTAVGEHLTAGGAELQVFHCTGIGGRTFESMVASGIFAAVADLTTTELADDLVGGVCSAGPHRLEAAAAHGVAQVVSVGALDMVNFGPRDTVPAEYSGRSLLAHNPSVTLMRTDADENAELGRRIARKLGAATGFVEVHVPRLGFSQVSVAGGPFHDPAADAALVDSLRSALDERIPLHVHELAINDPEFARHVGRAMDRALTSAKGG